MCTPICTCAHTCMYVYTFIYICILFSMFSATPLVHTDVVSRSVYCTILFFEKQHYWNNSFTIQFTHLKCIILFSMPTELCSHHQNPFENSEGNAVSFIPNLPYPQLLTYFLSLWIYLFCTFPMRDLYLPLSRLCSAAASQVLSAVLPCCLPSHLPITAICPITSTLQTRLRVIRRLS